MRGDCTRRCYAPAKPGRCPSSDPKPCSLILLTPECATDWDCSGDLKCCFDGCNKKCTSSFEKPRDGNLVFPCFLLHSSANLLPSFVLFCFFCFSCCGLFGCSLVRWFMVLFNRFCQFLVRSVVQRLSFRSLVGSDMEIKKNKLATTYQEFKFPSFLKGWKLSFFFSFFFHSFFLKIS